MFGFVGACVGFVFWFVFVLCRLVLTECRTGSVGKLLGCCVDFSPPRWRETGVGVARVSFTRVAALRTLGRSRQRQAFHAIA